MRGRSASCVAPYPAPPLPLSSSLCSSSIVDKNDIELGSRRSHLLLTKFNLRTEKYDTDGNNSDIGDGSPSFYPYQTSASFSPQSAVGHRRDDSRSSSPFFQLPEESLSSLSSSRPNSYRERGSSYSNSSTVTNSNNNTKNRFRSVSESCNSGTTTVSGHSNVSNNTDTISSYGSNTYSYPSSFAPAITAVAGGRPQQYFSRKLASPSDGLERYMAEGLKLGGGDSTGSLESLGPTTAAIAALNDAPKHRMDRFRCNSGGSNSSSISNNSRDRSRSSSMEGIFSPKGSRSNSLELIQTAASYSRSNSRTGAPILEESEEDATDDDDDSDDNITVAVLRSGLMHRHRASTSSVNTATTLIEEEVEEEEEEVTTTASSCCVALPRATVAATSTIDKRAFSGLCDASGSIKSSQNNLAKLFNNGGSSSSSCCLQGTSTYDEYDNVDSRETPTGEGNWKH